MDVWLWRARFAKTRAAAARLIAEGGVRLVRGDASRAIDKPSQVLALGDVLLIRRSAALAQIRVAGFGARRGPPAEARALYEDLPTGLQERSLDEASGAVHVSAQSHPSEPLRERE
jgi:ribosome-associated heat shock protein Hsp15